MSYRTIGNASLAVTNVTGRVALPSVTLAGTDGNAPVLTKVLANKMRLLVDGGGSQVFFKTGDITVVATTSDTYLPAGVIEVFNIPDGHSFIAAITAAGTATLRINTGGESNA